MNPTDRNPAYNVVYIVHEQWPHRDVASFDSLDEAAKYIREHELVLPVILSRNVFPSMEPINPKGIGR